MHPEVPVDANPTIEFAATELSRYVGQMSGELKPKLGGIRLGLYSDIPELGSLGLVESIDDDSFRVLVQGAAGYIAGSNPRSVLFAVYRLLEENGCRWVRPGPGGDYVPQRPVEALAADLTVSAAHRIRGFNDCGAYPFENLLDKVEWAPKQGFNAFMSEFFSKDNLYNFYYARQLPADSNSVVPANQLVAPRSSREIAAYHRTIEEAVALRGMSYHAIGHGWTGKVCGLDDVHSSVRTEVQATDEMRKHLALVNGQREFHPYGAVFTELCLGSPDTRSKLIEVVADYAESHAQIDVLHVWASDSSTWNCECELCVQMIPADRYVQMLNELDEELTRRGLATRLAFPIYHGGQLRHPPLSARIANPARFFMMFAPISRDYSISYAQAGDDRELPPFELNVKSDFTLEQYLGSLEGWRKAFDGQAFTFDYHFTLFHYFDPGTWDVVRVLSQDIPALPGLGLEGYIGCETVAGSFPNAFAHVAQARLLLDGNPDLEAEARRYYQAAYGVDADIAQKYLQEISGIFVKAHRRLMDELQGTAEGEHGLGSLETAVEAVVQQALVAIDRNAEGSEGLVGEMWQLLRLHVDYVRILSKSVDARLAGDLARAATHWTDLMELVTTNPEHLVPTLDLYYLQSAESWRSSPWHGLAGTRR